MPSYQLYLSKRSPPYNFDNLIVFCFHAQIPDFIDGFFIWGKKADINMFDSYQPIIVPNLITLETYL